MELREFFKKNYIETNGKEITRELAEGLVEDLAITDGSTRTNGEKWTIEETKDIGDELCIDWNKIKLNEFYLVINKIYSLFYSVSNKYGHNNAVFFGDFARAWLNDINGSESHTFDYFTC